MPRLTTLKSRLSAQPARLQALTIQPGTAPRLRGRAAVDRRARYLRLHPLCVECTSGGQTTAATTPDHKVPLWAGGPDDLEENGNALCTPHHDVKTACEARMRAAGGWMSTPCSCGQHI
jgi:hypothetical protein